jgi:hypothetical protein
VAKPSRTDHCGRYPVLPTIVRDNLSGEHRPSLTLVADDCSPLLSADTYWQDMKTRFTQDTKKPTDDLLDNFVPSVQDAGNFLLAIDAGSAYLVGEWLAELICLLPVQLAVTKDNRFVPLKDGMLSLENERALLGADVPTIADYLTLGLLESLLGNYFATRPVRVISSMGHQSVGKS